MICSKCKTERNIEKQLELIFEYGTEGSRCQVFRTDDGKIYPQEAAVGCLMKMKTH